MKASLRDTFPFSFIKAGNGEWNFIKIHLESPQFFLHLHKQPEDFYREAKGRVVLIIMRKVREVYC